ncbi:MAG: PEGA domain protein [Euryarchaeota archaeon ADurb.Bin294]|nr:MAG: PEGA domain protein [Euryarchaeota archaeon ADurb.Bin294]
MFRFINKKVCFLIFICMVSVITCTASCEEADAMYYNQQGTGIAEPFYPSSPPSPGTGTYEEPVQMIPVMTQYQDTRVAEPYYPQYPPQPEPVYNPPLSYPVYRYYEPAPSVRWYDDHHYRPSYYDKYDRSWGHYSYTDGTLKVSSTPHQAEVYLDNRFRGYTPYSGYLTLDNIRPGTYTLRLKYSGYYDYSEDVYISKGRTTYVEVDMVRIGERYQKTGLIYVQSEPSGAGVFLDNEYRGFTPLTLSGVPLAEHTLLVRKEGYIDYLCKVNVHDKQTVSISALLNPLEAPVTMAVSTPPVETPRPLPTRSGIMNSVATVAALMAVFLAVRNRYAG